MAGRQIEIGYQIFIGEDGQVVIKDLMVGSCFHSRPSQIRNDILLHSERHQYNHRKKQRVTEKFWKKTQTELFKAGVKIYSPRINKKQFVFREQKLGEGCPEYGLYDWQLLWNRDEGWDQEEGYIVYRCYDNWVERISDRYHQWTKEYLKDNPRPLNKSRYSRSEEETAVYEKWIKDFLRAVPEKMLRKTIAAIEGENSIDFDSEVRLRQTCVDV